MRPARLHVIRTNYPHWGRHAGIHQYLSHVDPARFSVDMHVAADGDADFPLQSPALRGIFSTLTRSGGMAWYGLSDLVAEWRAFRLSHSGLVELLHYLDGEHSAQFVPMLRRLSPRTRMIATYHQPARVLPGLVRRSAVDALDAITVVSPEQCVFFERYVPVERVHTILHGIDTTFFQPTSTPPPPRTTFECITVGHYLRDFATLDRALERLAGHADLRFHVVTDRETGLESRSAVTLHRDVSDEALLELYQNADLLLLPLTDCTANNTLLEGMACGLPVLATGLESVRVYAPGKLALLVPPSDSGALADGILELRNDPERRQAMGRAARLRAEELAWPVIAQQYAALYESLL